MCVCVQALQKDLRTARDLIAADKATAADLQQQLDQAVELYTAVQGETNNTKPFYLLSCLLTMKTVISIAVRLPVPMFSVHMCACLCVCVSCR